MFNIWDVVEDKNSAKIQIGKYNDSLIAQKQHAQIWSLRFFFDGKGGIIFDSVR